MDGFCLQLSYILSPASLEHAESVEASNAAY